MALHRTTEEEDLDRPPEERCRFIVQLPQTTSFHAASAQGVPLFQWLQDEDNGLTGRYRAKNQIFAEAPLERNVYIWTLMFSDADSAFHTRIKFG